MSESDRERSVERLLRRVTVQGMPTPGAGPCLDGETLAAWTERALPRAELDAVERHIADCARCQAMAAALARATPLEPVPEPLRRRWRLPWLVPIATAATAVIVWIAVPDPAPLAREEAADQLAASSPAGAAAPGQALPRLEPGQSVPAQPPPAPGEGPVVQESPALRERFALGEARQKTEVTPQAAEADQAKVAAAAPAPDDRASARSVSLEIAAPGSTARWRITGGRQVEWSSSGGQDWDALEFSSAGELTAGAAASGSVCWLVGRAGTVFLTTDGKSFTRVPFPEAVDLVAAVAPDERSATVTAADGRSWSTTDQGRSWTESGGTAR